MDKCLEMKAPCQVPGDFRRGRAYSELTSLVGRHTGKIGTDLSGTLTHR